MVSPQTLWLTSCIALVASATPVNQDKFTLDCANPQVKAIVSKVKTCAGQEVKTFCSSLLHYEKTTKTVVESYTIEEGDPRYVSRGTATFFVDAYTTTSDTTTMSFTVDVYRDLKKREQERAAAEQESNVEAREPAPMAVPRANNAVPTGIVQNLQHFPNDLISGACSCLVKKPVPKTVTSYAFTTEFITYTVTLPRKYVTSTVCN